MKIFGIRFVTAAIFSLLAVAGHATTSDWEDLGGGKARLLLTHDPATSAITAAVEIELDEGWSTYWRYPGSAGIPPVFDFTATPGLDITETHFQAPELLGDGPVYAGYKKSAVFLMNGVLQAGASAPITLDMLVGLCSTICVPAKAQFEVPRSSLNASDGVASRVISFAKLRLPDPDNQIGDKLDKKLTGKALEITISDNPQWDDPKLFVEGPKDWFLTPAKLVSRDNGKLVFSLYVGEAPDLANVMEQPLRYTLTTSGSSFEFQD